MDKYKDKKIAVLGYQVEGQSLINFFIRESIVDLTVIDEKEVDLLPDHEEFGVKLIVSSLDEVNLDRFDYVFRSPGINPAKLNLNDDKLTSAINLFFEYKKGKVIAVTGTKGKSTTVLLLKSILDSAGIKTYIAGNIGSSPLDFVRDLTDEDFTILELSSFQLMDFRYAPDYALVLPLYPDHLNYHADEKEYYGAKSRIFINSSETKKIVHIADVDKFSLNPKIDRFVTYSTAQNADCLLSENGLVCGEKLVVDGVKDFCREHQIPPVDLVAASTLAYAMNIKVELNKITDFKKMPMRIEFIGECQGVKFYNDSASTNPISTAAAISLMTEPFNLVIGGAGKNLTMDPLLDAAKNSSKLIRIYLIGEGLEDLSEQFEKDGNEIIKISSLKEFFGVINLSGVKAVLYSPAFASFDQYENYKERGEDFNQLFNRLCQNT